MSVFLLIIAFLYAILFIKIRINFKISKKMKIAIHYMLFEITPAFNKKSDKKKEKKQKQNGIQIGDIIKTSEAIVNRFCICLPQGLKQPVVTPIIQALYSSAVVYFNAHFKKFIIKKDSFLLSFDDTTRLDIDVDILCSACNLFYYYAKTKLRYLINGDKRKYVRIKNERYHQNLT